MDSPLDRRLFLGSALAAGAFPLAGKSAAQAKGGATLRFVNLNEVLRGWERAKKAHADLDAKLKARADELRQRASDLDKKNKEAQQFAVPNETSRRLEREVQLGVQALELDRNDLKRDGREEQLRLLLSEYQDIQDATARWAKQNQVDVVFAIIDEDPTDQDLAARYQRAVDRPVLFHAPELNVTTEILKLLQASAVPSPAKAESRPK
jgi:Skp family chaperone for outer membrane proteins